MTMSSSGEKAMKIKSSSVFLLGMLFLMSPLSVLADFDFYFLVLMWPGTYCEQSKCCRPTTDYSVNDFFIQNLQPANISTEENTKCTSEPFNRNDLVDLTERLDTYWSNIKCPNNDGWAARKSTWKSSGTCTGLNQYTYFSKAIEARRRFNVLHVLQENDITPSSSETYSLTRVTEAIGKGVGGKVQIRCNSKNQLYQVHICLYQSSLIAFDCPFDLGFTCPSDIYFPPVNQTKLINQTTKFNEGFMAKKIIMPMSLEY